MLRESHILEVRDISKIRARSAKETRSQLATDLWKTLIAGDLTRNETKRSSEFWALKDISFSLTRGEAVGIMGHNGAGKSTLLRLIAGQVAPDQGTIERLGQTESLINLTSGFNLEASGRENIYIRGALMRRSKQELEAQEQAIIDFAELESAIDAPVRTYSSGMLMRLAFSIAISSEPDVLLIDEVLAVGDFSFRQKCLGRIRELRSKCGFVLVSHSANDIRAFCDRVLVLHNGICAFTGSPDDAIHYYENNLASQESEAPNEILEPQYSNDESILDIVHFWSDISGNPIDSIEPGEPLYLKLKLTLARAIEAVTIGIPVWTSSGEYVTGFSTQITCDTFEVDANRPTEFTLEIPSCAFNPGGYLSNVTLLDGPEFLYRKENPLLHIKATNRPYWGSVTLEHKWHRRGGI